MHSTLIRLAAAACIALLSVFAASFAGAHGKPGPELSNAAMAARELPQLHSLLVSWRGDLVLEHYAPKITASRRANIKSASKSIISVLIGIAIDRRMIKGVDEPIATYLPQLARAPAAKRGITIEDLLTMRSGLESTSGDNYGPWVRSRNWVRYALDVHSWRNQARAWSTAPEPRTCCPPSSPAPRR
jgi:CubicO group peptidase (beta-lactamase class C family)